MIPEYEATLTKYLLDQILFTVQEEPSIIYPKEMKADLEYGQYLASLEHFSDEDFRKKKKGI